MAAIKLDFGMFTCEAELFTTEPAAVLYRNLPRSIILEKWGNELYGPLGIELYPEGYRPALVADIPPGGIAYSKKGNYLCIFFGQKPAWKVEHIGSINRDDVCRLSAGGRVDRVIISIV
ncbi:MAG TPA: cyclophilin-like fold protein [Spirochaetota bacterium]|nr:cyclophilin-like fold protein [Spirochaetota bacterium]HPI88747.1 cyclophilin-like fold protein [Spirochaetota bacterium]HPR47178.1 cyclophilin-like fold protein [Spirochaetota bacterium]